MAAVGGDRTFDLMKRHRFAMLAAVAALPCPPASASWSPPRTVPGSVTEGAGAPVLAVDGRGDLGAAWVDDPGDVRRVRHPLVTVRASVSRHGGFATHTLLRRHDIAVQGLAVVLDRRGELTVAWIDERNDAGLLHGHKTVRAAYRTPSGAWSAVQTVGMSSAFSYAVPRLAAAPDGHVLLTYVAGVRRAPGVGVAWRRPGRPFGALAGVGRRGLFDPTPAFDPDGRAYLSAITPCEESSSRGVLRTTAAGGHRFGPQRTIAPALATELRLQITGSRTAVAAWVRAGCSRSETLSGPIMAAAVHNDVAAPAQVLDPQPGRELVLAGAANGGADASWTAFPASAPAGTVLVAPILGGGTFGMPAAPTDGWTAVAADAAGDQVVAPRNPGGSTAPERVGARAAGTESVQTAPLPGPARYAAAGSGPDGRALAAAAFVAGRLRITSWTPVG
jgi:hypothetical protein